MEKELKPMAGIYAMLIQLVLVGITGYHIYDNSNAITEFHTWIFPAICIALCFALLFGYIIVNHNIAMIMEFMGKYKGTIRENGWFWANPFWSGKGMSLKVNNYPTKKLQVNDREGVPIEIAAIIVWKVGSTYKAKYDVQDLTTFIDNQFEVSLRSLAKIHTYSELAGEDRDFIADLTDKAKTAGIIIQDAKITHLTYQPEIAASMLQKQQAQATSDAKAIILDNAITMANEAVKHMRNDTAPGTNYSNDVEVKNFIQNLVLVLVADRGVQPVMNVTTG